MGARDVAIDGGMEVCREPPHPHTDREYAESAQRSAEERAVLILTAAASHPMSVIAHPTGMTILFTLIEER